MDDVIVELRSVLDRPNLAVTRDVLIACLIEVGLPPTMVERFGDFPSPSVLVDGVDVTGADPHRPLMCVLRPPTAEQIRTALHRALAGQAGLSPPLVQIDEFGPGDAEWARQLLTDDFGGPGVVSRGVLHDAAALPGFVARSGGAPVGLATYHVVAGECEVVVIDGRGVGAVLLAAVVGRARELGCRRAWLVTTNDNTRALRFYQRQGWDLVSVHRDAVTASRRIKPTIPLLGADGIPIRHELELELVLEPVSPAGL